MPLDVVGDERAERRDLEALPARILERSRRQQAAEAAALARFVHLGVREGDPAVATAVGGEPDQATPEPKLVAALLGHVDDLRLGRRSFGGLELVRAAEVLEQLAGDVRLARDAV